MSLPTWIAMLTRLLAGKPSVLWMLSQEELTTGSLAMELNARPGPSFAIAASLYFQMTLYSYVVARDYGFAPNPFYDVCTLATCKPLIRRRANIDDWVVGTGSKSKELQGHVVFAMQVAETLTFDQYWNDARFLSKRPHLDGSLKQALGDNIYHHASDTGKWVQENSHHSFSDGLPNLRNIQNDTQTDRVLVGVKFAYWGRSGPLIPREFRGADFNVCAHRGHKCKFSNVAAVDTFIQWIRSLDVRGYVGVPAAWT